MARLVWAAVLGVGIVAEVRSLRRHDGCTLSETTRMVFRTETRVGRIAFAASWGAFTAWWIPHVLKEKS